MMAIPVIIPIFNRADYTISFLENLRSQKHGERIFPILVNNGSKKSTTSIINNWIQLKFPDDIERPFLINSDTNTGFSGGVNLALSFLKEQKLLFSKICILHNDTILTKNWIKEMSEVIDEDENVGVAVPLTNYSNENSMCIKDIRSKFEKIKCSNKDRIEKEYIENTIKNLYIDIEDFALSTKNEYKLKSSYCPEISSFCMLVREGMFEKYGFFDEDFWPKGYEEKLWFSGLQMDGWICSISNKSFVHHFGNITSDGPGFSFPDIMRINQLKFKEKIDNKIINKNK